MQHPGGCDSAKWSVATSSKAATLELGRILVPGEGLPETRLGSRPREALNAKRVCPDSRVCTSDSRTHSSQCMCNSFTRCHSTNWKQKKFLYSWIWRWVVWNLKSKSVKGVSRALPLSDLYEHLPCLLLAPGVGCVAITSLSSLSLSSWFLHHLLYRLDLKCPPKDPCAKDLVLSLDLLGHVMVCIWNVLQGLICRRLGTQCTSIQR